MLGRNGAGKSTLLQLAAGVLRPGRGRVADRPPRVGWVPERFPADQPFTVARYLTAHGPRRAVCAGRRPTRRCPPGPTGSACPRFRASACPSCPRAPRRRSAWPRRCCARPGLLVLDEPWEGLDAATRELVPELIAEVLAADGAVLVSDHRGETVRLPGARRWSVADGTVTEETPSADATVAVVEVAVPAARAGRHRRPAARRRPPDAAGTRRRLHRRRQARPVPAPSTRRPTG